MLDVLRCAIGCIFERALHTCAARLGFRANGRNLFASLGCLFFGVFAAKFDDLDALLFFGPSPLLSSHHFARTLDRVVRIRKACGVLAVLTAATVFAVALRFAAAGSAARIKA